MTETIQRSALEHIQLAPGRFRGNVFHCHCQSHSADIQIDYGSYNVPVLARGPMPDEAVTLGFLMRSPGETTFYCEPAPEGTLAVWGESTEMHTVLAANSQWFTLQISRGALSSDGIELPESVRAQYPLDRGTRMALERSLRPAMLQFNTTHTTTASQSYLPSVVDDLADNLASSLGRVLEAQRSRRTGHAALRRRREAELLERAEAYIAANLAEPVTVRGMCSEIECPIHTVERIFKKSLGLTPKQFLTLRRLAELRRLLLSRPAGDMSVSSAAISCGLTHLGRTATAYYRIYGESPSETLRTSRPVVVTSAAL